MVWKVCVTIYTCRIYIEPWGWWRDRTGGLGSHDGVFWFESCGENTRLFGKVGMKHLTPLRYDLRFRLESTRQANSPTKCNAFKVRSTPTRSSLLGKTTFFRPLSDYVPSNNCRKAFFNFRAPPPRYSRPSHVANHRVQSLFSTYLYSPPRFISMCATGSLRTNLIIIIHDPFISRDYLHGLANRISRQGIPHRIWGTFPPLNCPCEILHERTAPELFFFIDHVYSALVRRKRQGELRGWRSTLIMTIFANCLTRWSYVDLCCKEPGFLVSIRSWMVLALVDITPFSSEHQIVDGPCTCWHHSFF